MSKINIYKSAAGNNYETVEVCENMSIREALPELDFDRAIIAVNGFQVDEGYGLQDNDICTIRLFPKATAIFITAAVITGLAISNEIVRGLTGQSLIQHIANALWKWLAPDTPDVNSPAGTENIPQLRGAKNQSNKNKPIPLVLGKHFYTPMYIGSPYTEISGTDGEDQYYNALYLLGWGKLKVNDIRLGPVSGLSRNVNNKLDGMLLYDDEPKFGDPSFKDSNPLLELRHTGEVGLYDQRVVEERLSIELINADGKKNEPTRFSAKNPQRVQVEITFNNGLISYNDEGKKRDASVSVIVEWRYGQSDNTWKEFGRFGTNGGQSPTQYNSSTHVTTITRQKPKQMRFIAERTFSFAEASEAVNRTIELKISRTNPKDINDSRTSDNVFLSAIRTWCFDYDLTVANNGVMIPQAPMVQKYRDQTARLGFRIKATDIMQGTIDALNCMVESYARTWDGAKWSDEETWTNNPASVALKVLQSPALGKNAYPDSMLDLDSFGEFYQWCKNREYTCNGVLTNEKRVDELLNAVLSTGRGMRILNDTRYAVLIDKPRENPVTILNNQNVLEATNQKSFDDLPDGFSIKFVNESDGYQETEIFVMADGSAQPKPLSRIESIEMPFITNHEQIVKNGWYMLACRYLRPEIWRRKLSIDGYLLSIGSLVEVQDDTIAVGIGEGAVITGLKIENDFITEIQTDGIFDVIDASKLYGIKIMQFNGINHGKVRTIQVPIPKPGTYSNFTVSIPVDDYPPLPGIGNIIAFGVYEKITTQAICFGKKPNGDGTFDVTLIPYQEGVYTTDKAREIPPYNANITPPQGIPPLTNIPSQLVTKDELIETVSGIEGQPAVMYELQPSVRIIVKDNNGVFSPNTISCLQVMINGNNPPISSNKMLQYITSKSGMAILYTGAVPVGDWDWIEFILSDNGIELCRQRAPVLSEGSDSVYLDLEYQNYLIFCLYDGRIKENQIPFTIQASLYRGISVATDIEWRLSNAPRGITINSKSGLITAAAEYRYINDIPHYPGYEDIITDPMQGTFFPCPPEKDWPIGHLNLGTDTEIYVHALYQGEIFSRVLRITKIPDGAPGTSGKDGKDGEKGEQGDPSPRYLGKTNSVGGNTGIVQIWDNGNTSRQVQAYKGDYVSYVGNNSGIWEKGLCMRWTGTSWEQIQVKADGNFESNPYMQAMFDLTEGAPMGTFMSILVRELVAKTAMIENIFAKWLTITVGGGIKSDVLINGERSFEIDGDTGILKAVNAFIKGRMDADSGTFRNGNFTGIEADGIKITGDSSFSGDIDSGVLKVLKSSSQPFSLSYTSTSTEIQNFVNKVRNDLGYPASIQQFTVYPTSGSYYFWVSGSSYVNETIRSIIFTVNPFGQGSSIGLRLISINNRTHDINTQNRFSYNSNLTFYVGVSARTLRLEGLPTSTGTKNEVYMIDDGTGNYYLKLKK